MLIRISLRLALRLAEEAAEAAAEAALSLLFRDSKSWVLIEVSLLLTTSGSPVMPSDIWEFLVYLLTETKLLERLSGFVALSPLRRVSNFTTLVVGVHYRL